MRNSIIAIVLSTAIGALLFWPWDLMGSDAATGVGIEDREYEVWLSVIYRGENPADRSKVVLDPRTGLAPRHSTQYCEAIGELVLHLGGFEVHPNTFSPRVAPEDFPRASEAVADFAAKNKRPWVIDDRFGDIPELIIASREAMDASDEAGRDRWKEFRNWFEDGVDFTTELVTLSRVGFSCDGTIAIVDWYRGSGSLSGVCGLLVLKLVDGTWKLVGLYGGWKS